MKRSIVREFGQPNEVVQLEAFEPQALQSGEIRVRMLVAPINPADLNFVQGNYGIVPELPVVPGIEGCGVVVESRSENIQLNTRVIFQTHVGTWTDEVVCADSAVITVPDDTPVSEAAMLKVNPLTAWCLLTQFIDLPKGSWIVQNAANSGVGIAVIQIAKILGLKTINLVRREELVRELLEKGANVVLLDDNNCCDEIRSVVGDSPPRLALNAVGGDSALRLMDVLAPEGKHITFGAMSRRSLKVPNKFLIFKRIQLHGFWLTEWMKDQDDEKVMDCYRQLATWAAEGRLSQPVDSTFPLSEINAAIARSMQDKRNGKVLIRWGS